MFNLRDRASTKGGVPVCVRLPAAAAFPTDVKLLQRIESSRNALPANSVKSLRRPNPGRVPLRVVS
jgi:hypothetical protein